MGEAHAWGGPLLLVRHRGSANPSPENSRCPAGRRCAGAKVRRQTGFAFARTAEWNKEQRTFNVKLFKS